MHLPLDKKFIPTKVAAKLSGYNSDYISRLCRERKIVGSQVGRVWFVEKASLEKFIRQQEERKREISRELSKAREVEYQAHNVTPVIVPLVKPLALPKMSGPTLREVHPLLRPGFALAVTVLVMAGSVYAAESGMVNRIEDRIIAAAIAADQGQTDVPTQAARAVYRIGDALEQGTMFVVTSAPRTYGDTMVALAATPRESAASVATAPVAQDPGMGASIARYTYSAITNFFTRVSHSLAVFFGFETPRLTILPFDAASTIYQSTGLPAPYLSPSGDGVVYQPIRNQTTNITYVQGVSETYVQQYVNSYLAQALAGLSARIGAQVLDGQGAKQQTTVASSGSANSMDGGTIVNSTITNSTFTGGAVVADSLTVNGATTLTGTTTVAGPVVFGAITGSTQCLHVDAAGVVSGTGVDCGVGGGGGLNGLRAQYSSLQTGSTQTFATSSDANLGLTITSAGDIHTFAPVWTGILSVARGGTGLGVIGANQLLIGNSAGTGYSSVATSSLGLSTTNINEGSNLFYSLGRFASALAGTTTDALAEGLINKYYTDARARSAFTATATGLSYATTTGTLSLSTGYAIPLSASSSNWNGFYDVPSTRITAGTNLSWSGNTLNGSSDSYLRALLSASSPLAYDNTSGAFSLAQASASANGYLSSTDWTTFNGKFATTSTNYYLSTKTTDSLAQGTVNLYYQDALVSTFLNSIAKSYFYSTSSADYWKGQRDFFSTTSASYFLAQNQSAAFSTSSANYYLSQNRENAFATTSANYFFSTKTTDSLAQGVSNLYYQDSLVNTYVGGSTTIAKTYTNNVFTGGNTFAFATITNATSTNLNIAGTITGGGLSACSTSSDKLLWDSATGRFTCGSDAGAGGGITSIRGQYSSSQTGAGQILATTSDTNIGLNITSAGDIHTFSPVWIGTLGINRGGTGIQSTPSYGQILLGNGSGYTLTATSSLGLESSLTFSTPLSRTGNAISIQVANDSQGGYLAATDWTTFNNKISSTSLSATGPLSYNSSTGVFSLGTVGVANGGTGWAAIQAGTLLYGNGSGALATTTSGTNGYVLALVNGTPTWQATTTLSTISGLLSLSSQVSGTLGVANGGTASTTLSGLLMGNGTSAVQTAIAGVNYLAPGSLSSTATGLTYTSGTGVFSLTAGYSIPLTASTTDWNTAYSNRITSATYPLQISSNVLSLAFGTTTANSWSQLQQFNGNASTTQLTVTGNTYLSTAGGTVAIGTTNTGGQAKLSVLKTDSDAWVSSVVLQDNANFTTNMTSNSRNLDVSIYTNVAATKTVTGTISAANLLAVRSYSTQNGVESGDQGTLAELAGMSVAFGGVNNGSSPITTLATGIHITPFFSGGSLTTAADLYLDNPSVSGATVGSYYGIYQKDSAASNYFAGNVGVGTTTPGASFGVAGASLFSGLSTFSSGINVNGETVTDLTGTGLTNVGGALTVNVSGDWTGTFDGQEGTYYLNRTNHTGTQLAATISDFSATARALFSSTAAGLTYTSGTGVFSLTAGYSIPLTASTTEWSTAYSGRITSATYPLQIASNVISIAFGTTTSNTWAGTQTFTNPIVIGSGTGTTTIASNIGITGSIIPSADNVYSLGSTAFKWKDVYIGPGSLYINGQKVLQEDVSSDIVVSADINQNLKVKTTGTGNIELNPSGSGQILLKANLSISAGKTVTNSDSSAVSFPNGAAGGNITISGNAITATNLNGGISITPAGSGGTYVTAGNFGIATTSPTNKLEVNGNTFLGGSLSVSGNTNLSGATSTSFAISNLSSVLIKANASGSLIPAVAGTDYLSSASLTASYPIQLSGNNFSLAFGTTTANSWSSLQTFNGNASTTQISAAIGFFNSILATSTTATSTFAGGLSVGPNALNVLQNGKIGIGTAAPGTTLDITGTARVSSTLSLSSIASCIGSQALQTDASGNISCGNITTGGASSGGGWTTNNVGVVGLSTTTDKVVVGASTTPYAKFTVLSGSTATTTFALFPASGQIANIFDIYNTTGALTSVINANGFLGLGTTTATQQLSVQGNALFSGNIAAAGLTATGTVTFSGLGSGLVKSTAGVLSVATAGTDYENALTFDYPLVRTVNAISLAFGTTTANVWSGSNTFNGGVTIASLNGPLQANNGVVSATSSVGVLYGGTGLTSGPSYGQILVGNASNGYTLTATSSLGLLSSAIQNLGPAGQLQNGSTVTLATSTSVVNGQTHTLTITAAGNTITYTPSVSGTLTVAGGGTGQTTFTSGQLIYGNGTNGLTSVATGTVAAGTGVSVTGGQSIIGSGLTITNTGVIAVGPAGQTTNGTALLATSTAGTDFTITGVGSTLTFNLPTASASNRGALSSADWTTFNGKQAALSFTYPLANSANIISLAFGTTTTNSWSSLQTFNGGITTSGTVTLGALTGVLHASSGIVSASNVLLGSEVSGILPTTNGGSGWSTIVANTVLLGNGTGSFATTSAGVNGQSLALVNGVPTWVATSTLATISGQLNLASQVTGTLPVGNGGTGSTTLSGILKGNGTGAIVTAIGGTDYEVPLTFSTGLNRAGNVITNTGVLSAIAGTGVSVSGATGNVTISNTGLLSLQQLGGGTAQTGALTFATSSATNNGVTLGLNITNTAGAFTFTPTLSGTLTVAGGGTGITTVADGALLFGSGSTALNTLATSTAGKVLQLDYSTGRPSWVATSTLGLITAAVQNLGPAGQLQSGPTITIASTTSTTNGLTSAMTITAAGNTITYAPSLSGTLTVAGGGTGQTSFTSGQLLYGNGTNGLTSVATGTVSAGTGVSVTGGQSVIGSGLVITNTGVTSNVAGTGISVSGATGAVTINNTGVLSLAGTANQITASAATGAITLSIPSQFNIQNASTTNLSANTLAVGGTATSSISSTGVLSLAGLTNSLLYTNGSGAVSAVTVSSPLTFTTGTLAIQVGNGSQNGYLSSGDWTTFNNKISSTSLSAGTGISYNSATGVITNTGVTSNVAGTGISVSGATGAVTVTNTGVIAVGPAGQTTNGTALFATSTTGTDFTITGSGATITFNLPTASASIRGALSSTDWSTFNGKQAALSFTYPLVNSANTISLAFGTTTTNTWSALQTFNGGITTAGTVTLGSLTGPLQALNGVVSATSTLSTFYGGTGISTAPIYGQVLVGNAAGTYTLTATSSLGFGTGSVTSVNASGGTTGLSFSGGPITTNGTLTLAGTLGIANGGTGSTTLSGILVGNGTSAVNTLTLPTFLSLSGSTLSLGTLGIANGGTGTTTGGVTNGVEYYDGTKLTNSGAFTWNGATLGVNGFINIDQYGSYKQAGNTILYASSTNKATLVGISAGSALTSAANYTVAVGNGALSAATNAQYNTALGYQALTANTSGAQNTSVGALTLSNNLTGAGNVAVGYGASYYNTFATSTVAVGQEAGNGIAGNYANKGSVAVGYRAGYNFYDASNFNTLLGYQAGYNINTGANNIVIGADSNASGANSNIDSGSNNIQIGYNISLPDGSASDQLNIGNLIYGTNVNGSGGTISSGNLGVGTTTPSVRFAVQGNGLFSGDIALANLMATGTVTFSGLGSGLVKSTSGVLSVATAGTDYENALTFGYPLVRSVNAVSLAFGTTTANSWSALQTFNGNASTTQLTTTGNAYLATAGGSVGIGSTSPNALLSVGGVSWLGGPVVVNNQINTSSGLPVVPAFGATLTVGTTTSANVSVLGEVVTAVYNGPASASVSAQGINAFATLGSSATGNLTVTSNGGGLRNRYSAINASAGYSSDYMSALSSNISVTGTLASSTNATAYNAETPSVSSGDLITNYRGLWVRGGAVTGTITNRYGVYIDDQVGGTNRYGFYQAGASDSNYFAGNTGIGSTTPGSTFSVQGNGLFSGNLATAGLTATGTVTFSGLGTGLVKSTSGVLSVATAGTDYENALTFGYPLVRSVNAVSLAFGTTTANSWSALQEFNGNASTTQLTTTGNTYLATASGKVAVGATSTPYATLSVVGNGYIGESGLSSVAMGTIFNTYTTDLNSNVVLNSFQSSGSLNTSGGVQALQFNVTDTGSNNVGQIFGINGLAVKNGSGSVSATGLIAIQGSPRLSGTATAVNQYAFNAQVRTPAGTAASTTVGYNVATPSSGGTIVSAYGFRTAAMKLSGVTTGYGFASDGASDINYFLGSTGVGTTTPGSTFSVQGNGLFSGNLSVAGLTATGTISLGSLSGVLYGNSGAVTSVATSSITAGTGVSFTGTPGALVGGTALTITNTGVTSNVAGTGIGVSGATGAVTVTNTGLLSLQQLGGGAAQTGAITFATSSTATTGLTLGLNITNTAGAFTLAPSLSGTLNVANGGTGAVTLSGLLQGNGTSAITGITGTAGQFPYYNGSNTLLATSSVFLATSGKIGIGGNVAPAFALDVKATGGNDGIQITNDGGTAVLTFNTYSSLQTFTSPVFNAARARGSLASPANPQDGDSLFAINTGGYTNVMDANAGARVTFAADGNWSSTSAGTKIMFAVNDGTTEWNGGAVTALTIRKTGYIGVGTTTPGALFGVQGNGLFSGNLSVAGLTATGTVSFTGLGTGLVKSTSGVLSIASAGTDYQAPITLTTTGTSGAATFIGNTLNVPQYAGTSYTATYPITLTGSAFGLAFGTTTANSWSALQTFNGGVTANALTLGSLSGVLYGNSGAVTSVATSSITAGTGVSFTGTPGALVGGTALTITNTGVTSNVAGTGISVSGATGAVTVTNTGVIAVGPAGQTTNGTALFATSTTGTDFTITGSGATITFNLPTASASIRGALSSTDWSTFNGKQAALSFTYPLVNSANTISLAFGTTTANSWSALQQFNANASTTQLSVSGNSYLSNLVFANAATTTVVNNNAYAWTIATSTTAKPLFKIDTTTGSEGVTLGTGLGGSVIIGAVGVTTNLVFEENTTIKGQSGGRALTFGATGDTINFAVNLGIGTTSASKALSVQGNGLFSGDIFAANLTATGTAAINGTATIGNIIDSGLTANNLTYTNASKQLVSVATTSLAVGSELTYSGTFGALVGGANGTLTITANGVALTKLATIAANSILGNSTGATGNVIAIATSSLFTWAGTGDVVRATNPILITPNLGTPSALTLTNATGLPLSTGVTGTLPVANGGTGVATFTSGQLLYGNGTNALTSVATSSLSVGTGLSSSGTLGAQIGGTASSISFAAIAANSLWVNQTGSSAVPTVIATSSLFVWNGTGSVVRDTSPTLTTPNLGTPSTLVLTNATGLPLSTGVTGTLGVANGGTGSTTLSGILIGNGTSAVQTVIVGSGLSLVGTTLTASGGSGTVGSGTTGQFPYYAANGTTLTATSSIFLATNGYVGIGTTSPSRALTVYSTVAGEAVLRVDEPSPRYELFENDQAAGSRRWNFWANNGQFDFFVTNDNGSTNTSALSIARSGTSVTNVNIPNSPLSVASTSPWGLVSINPSGVSGPAFVIGSSTGTSFMVNNAGVVGIGFSDVSNMTGLLRVNGGIQSSLLRVTSAGNSSDQSHGLSICQACDQLGSGAGASAPGGDWVQFANHSGSGGFQFNATSGDVFNLMDATAANTSFDVQYRGSSIFKILGAGNVGIGTTTPGTLFSLGSSTSFINLSNTATSTFAFGLNIMNGCYAVNGTCLTNGGGSGTVGSGTTGQFPYYAANGTTLTATSSLFMATSGKIGVGSTSPYANLSVHAAAGSTNTTLFAIGSSTASATTTLFSVDNTGLTAIGNSVGTGDAAFQFASDVNAWAVGYNSSDKSFTIASSTLLTSNAAFTIAKGISSNNIGIGSSTPGSLLSIGSVNGINFSTATSTFSSTGGINLAGGCYAVNGTCLGSGSGTGVVGSGTTGQFPYYAGSGTTLTATSSVFMSAAGNLGLGTTSPYAQLSILGRPGASVGTTLFAIASSSGSNLFSVSGDNVASFGDAATAGDAIFQAGPDTSAWSFGIASTTKSFIIASSTDLSANIALAIAKGGNVGIGTSSPSTILTVGGNVLVGAATAGGTNGTLSVANLASCGGIQTNANGLMSCTSDARLKDVSSAFTAGLDAIRGISPQTYSWKENTANFDGGVSYSGFIAQNVAANIPEASNVNAAGYLQINTTTILAASINAIKELAGRTDMLSLATTSLSARLAVVEQKAAPAPLQTFQVGSLTVTGTSSIASLTANQVRATSFNVAPEVQNYIIGTTSITVRIPNEALTASGDADLYKLATYSLAMTQNLSNRFDALDAKVATLDARLAVLENVSIVVATTTATSTEVAAPANPTAFQNLFSSFGALIQNGIAQFNTLVARQFVASKDVDGTSSAGTGTILSGNTTVVVQNKLVRASSKVFVTFNGPVEGSWYLSEKQQGSFKVTLANAASADVTFDYFIVQTEGQIASAAGANADTVPPEITLNGSDPLYVAVGDTYADPGVIATDAVDGSVEYNLQVNGRTTNNQPTIDTSSSATYTLTYTAFDKSGNFSTKIRTVVVAAPGGSTPAPTPGEGSPAVTSTPTSGTTTPAVAPPASDPTPTPTPTPTPAPAETPGPAPEPIVAAAP